MSLDESEATVTAAPEPDEDAPRSVTEAVTVGKYQLAFELASGGMASVFLARAAGPAGFEKIVALKRIHPHLAAEQAYVDMFLDEARIASRITHANVCSVFDFGEADGEYFIAMEYLMGQPLSKVLHKVHLDRSLRSSETYPSFVARLLTDAAEGLHAAHELRDTSGENLGVVHRDVSPQNLFLTYDGTCRVVDFGIARARDKLHQTATGEMKGKFAYMAPEQIRDDQEVDRRADVWALGVMLWEMLTLRRLFRRETQSKTLYAVLESPVLPPSDARRGVPSALDDIVLRALDRDPDRRPPTARAFGQELSAYLASTGRSFGGPELAQWMATLFPDGEARARHLIDVAKLEREPVPKIPRGDADDSMPASEVSPIAAAQPPRGSGWSRGRLVAAALVGALGAGGLGGLGLLSWGANPPATPRTSPAAPSAQGDAGPTVEETIGSDPNAPRDAGAEEADAGQDAGGADGGARRARPSQRRDPRPSRPDAGPRQPPPTQRPTEEEDIGVPIISEPVF